MNEVSVDKKVQEVVFLRGLPASSKSTYAREWVSKDASRIRVNKDDIRKMIGYERCKENTVLQLQRAMISKALELGNSVIIDDTNFNPIHLDWLNSELEFYKLGGNDIRLSVIDMNVTLDECIKRDSLRTEGRVGEKVIIDMYSKYVLKK